VTSTRSERIGMLRISIRTLNPAGLSIRVGRQIANERRKKILV
jgi:hypothetical protein